MEQQTGIENCRTPAMKEARLSHATFEAFLRQPKREKNYRGCRDYDHAPLNGTKSSQICLRHLNANKYLQ